MYNLDTKLVTFRNSCKLVAGNLIDELSNVP